MSKEKPRLRGRGRPRADGIAHPVEEQKFLPREIALIKALTAGSTIAEAYKAAGYTGQNANKAGWEILERIRRKAPDIMNRVGLNQENLINDYLKPMLNATEVKVFKQNGMVVKDEDGNEKMSPGEIIYSDPLVAWEPRRAALDMSFRLHGSYAKTGEDPGSVTNNNLTIINHIERPERKEKVIDTSVQ
jgi:hypothetical protein